MSRLAEAYVRAEHAAEYPPGAQIVLSADPGPVGAAELAVIVPGEPPRQAYAVETDLRGGIVLPSGSGGGRISENRRWYVFRDVNGDWALQERAAP